MDKSNIAYLINSTPKYFYILDLHLTMLKRYASDLQWPIYLATEEPNNPLLLKLKEKFPFLIIIPLTEEQEPFFESRIAAIEALPPSIDYIFPIQDDFLLEGRPMSHVIEEVIDILENNPLCSSLRLMPCPGPSEKDSLYRNTVWRILDFDNDSLIFTYQATIWRRESYLKYMRSLLTLIPSNLSRKERNNLAIKTNIAEIHVGQNILREYKELHLAWPREGVHPNAVYLSPWPYRPTAIVRGKLEPWVVELAQREKVSLYP
jgi:hypothetical protein